MRNPWLCITIVVLLGLGGLLGFAGYIILPLYGREIPQALVAAAGVCWGALSTFLVQPPRGQIGLGDLPAKASGSGTPAPPQAPAT